MTSPAPADGAPGSPDASQPSGLNPVLTRNIAALIERRRAEEAGRSFGDRLAARVARFSGSLPFVYIHVVVIVLWVSINVGWIPIHRFDPTFVILGTSVSVEAVFLATFVLMTQNRMARTADHRADLDLQISLLAEHEISRLIGLTTAIAAQLAVEHSHDPDLPTLAEDVHPETILDAIEEEDG